MKLEWNGNVVHFLFLGNGIPKLFYVQGRVPKLFYFQGREPFGFLELIHIATQPHSHIQPHSYIATQPQSHIAAPPLWRRPEAASFVAMQLCGCVALWLCSYAAMWLYGYVAMWLSSKIPKFQNFKKVLDIPKNHFMFSDRYWSHLQDFQEIIGRAFIIFRCPSVRTMSKSWIS